MPWWAGAAGIWISAKDAQENVLTYGAGVAQSRALSGRTKVIVPIRKPYHNKNPTVLFTLLADRHPRRNQVEIFRKGC
jgi:hypothetical protein